MEEKTNRISEFKKLFLPTLFYAIIYTFCMYKNLSGLLMVVFVIATIVYSRYFEKTHEIIAKPASIFYEIIMILLAISSGTTGNEMIIAFNTVGICLLIVLRLIHNAYDDSHWDIWKYCTSIGVTIFDAIASLIDFFADAKAYAKSDDEKSGRKKNITAILIGIGIAIPLLGVIIALLYNADAVFAKVIRDIFRIDAATLVGIAALFVFALLSAYCGVRAIAKQGVKPDIKDHKKYSHIIAITVLSLIAIVYLLFSGIQIVYLFMGRMSLPDGYTYAKYAREGFFELLAVCIINVIIVLVVLNFFEKNKILNALLTVISATTYIMIASASLRMCMYIEAYNLTRKRIMVLWALATIALLMVGVMIYIFKKSFPMFRYGVIVFCICYLVLSFMRMDYFIAKYDLKSGQTDDLAKLSTDAAPVLADTDGIWMVGYKTHVAGDLRDSVRQFNVSHYIAKKTLHKYDVPEIMLKYIKANEKTLTKVADSWLNEEPTYDELDSKDIYVNSNMYDEDGKNGIVSFSCKNSEWKSEVYSMGFYYSPDDKAVAHITYEPGKIKKVGDNKWKVTTENYNGEVEKLMDHWYYYKATDK